MASSERELTGHLEPGVDLGGGGACLASLTRLLEVRPASPLRSVPGRETFVWPEDGEPVAVVKRTRGVPWRDRWYERSRGTGQRSPGRREYDNLVGLAADGIRVPRGLGWAEGADRRSLVVMEYVPHDQDLREWLGTAGERGLREVLPRLVSLVSRLHERGWYHRDLYLQHFLPLERGELLLLDLGRARREGAPRRRWFVKDLGALLHSTPERVLWSWRLRFLARYLDARGIVGRGQRRRWAREVESRRRKLAGHVPRFGETGERG